MKRFRTVISRSGLFRAFRNLAIFSLLLAVSRSAFFAYCRYRNNRYFATHYVVEKVEIANFVSSSNLDLTRCASVTIRSITPSPRQISWWPPHSDLSSEDNETYAVLIDAVGTQWMNADKGSNEGGGTAAMMRRTLTFCNSRPSDIPLTTRPLRLKMKLWLNDMPVFISVIAHPKIGRWNQWYLSRRNEIKIRKH